MIFSVIYSVDCPKDISIAKYVPPKRHKWTLTEGDSCANYEELPKHRKWITILNKRDFDEFCGDLGLFAEDVETLGAIGTPGCGFALAPAISFRSDNCYACLNAYVTPIPEVHNKKKDEPFLERDWERVRRAVINLYE